MLPFNRLDDLRRNRPLIHCIANAVSANDCANLILSAGASPIMAQAPEEMEEITALSEATVLNTGTPSSEKFALCRTCGMAASSKQPVVLDPVGVGASSWRLHQTEDLLRAFSPDILRVNLGEAQALLNRPSDGQGVDFTGDVSMSLRSECARKLAASRNTVVLLSGPEDIVTDGKRICCVKGGSVWMSGVTGTGCMLSALCGAFAAVEPDSFLAASLAAACWKVCAQRAEKALLPGQAAGTFRVLLMDAMSLLDKDTFTYAANVVVKL